MNEQSSQPAAATIWLSPDGDDGGSGSREAPFRTLGHARSEVCRFAARAPRGSSITVVLDEGTYPLAEPLVFDPERFGRDGPAVRFVAAGDAAPVISGGRRIGGWTLHDADLNIYKASAQGLRARQLYVDGRRAVRASTTMPDGGIPASFKPNAVPLTIPQPGEPCPMGGGIDFRVSSLNPARWRDPSLWHRPSQIDAVIVTQWKMMSVPVRSIAASDGTILLAQPGWTNANLYFTAAKNPADPPITAPPGVWSFWQVTRFENDYSFLDEPGEWVLDTEADALFYIPRPGEDMAVAEIILPALEVLVEGIGTDGRPVCGLSFEGIAFRHATWLGPSSEDGYVADQSGFHLRGDGHGWNITGHEQHVERTPGNLRFAYAHNIRFDRCRFEQLGAVALDFDTGSQCNRIARCTFDDIASAAIQIGGVAPRDYDPTPHGRTRDNIVTDNLIRRTGRDYVDSAALYLGFTTGSLVANNTISEVPWTGIALGWGWGLLDPGSFPGISFAVSGMWGVHTGPTVNCGNRILRNHISSFLEKLWDGGAIYCCGWQGNSFDDALLIEGNVACGKRPAGGGNVIYTDGGSRYILVRGNALFDNEIGKVDFGPKPREGDPLPYEADPSKINGLPYGGDIGGCRTYGDIVFEGNYWAAGWLPLEEAVIDAAEALVSKILTGSSFYTYSPEGFFDVCPYSQGGVSYPVNLAFKDNHALPFGRAEVPGSILVGAGVRDGDGGYVAAGAAPRGGGASFPPLYPGPSWNVPRVSLPGLFGVQPQYGQEWWYYVGVAETSRGRSFSLQLEILRMDIGLQAAMGLTGIGWRDDKGDSSFLSAQGIGFGLGSWPWSLAAAVIPPVSDTAFSAHLRPLIEVIGRAPNLSRDLHWNLPVLGTSKGWKFDYEADRSNGAPIGAPGSRYTVSAQGQGLVASAGVAATCPALYAVALDLTDLRGMVMEGLSGYVGPGMFADRGVGLDSYECAQPVLRIDGGTLTIDDEDHRVAGGTLWLDRQLIARAAAGARPRGALRAALRGEAQSLHQLYVGDWIAITLDDGRSLAVAEFWQPSSPQWLTGTGVGKPPQNGFANLYFPHDASGPQGNGGLALKARTTASCEDWDFDLNVLDPEAREASPHWKSPQSGRTYATAWRIDFAPRAQRAGLPAVLYLRAISDNCEIIPAGPDSAFFEGAALVYADREFRRRLGQAFVEQMGFN
jgi:hypothetical protein